MANHGGKRPGAGRPKGAKDRATAELIADLSMLARCHTKDMLDALVAIAKTSESDAARVSAAVAVLDRGYGRPAQVVIEVKPAQVPDLGTTPLPQIFDTPLSEVITRFTTARARTNGATH